VAHAYLSPSEPEFKDLEASIVRYEYDARKAVQMVEALGNSRGTDGGFRDSEGRRVGVEIRVSARNPLSNKSVLAVADSWQQVGIAAEPLVIPTQRADDREYVANFPAFHLYRQPNDIHSVKRYHGSQSRTAERNYVGLNYNRYMTPEFDGLVDRYFATIPRAERVQVLGQILYHMTDQLLLMGLFHDVEATMIHKRIISVGARYQTSTQAWNAHEWEVKS
jgi:ABC-type transport system substrate-binding protein